MSGNYPITTNFGVNPMVSARGYHTVGLKSDGTVVAVGLNDDGQCDVSSWDLN
jgi:alpha-tubulin suppressor-like RCC1 family protein